MGQFGFLGGTEFANDPARRQALQISHIASSLVILLTRVGAMHRMVPWSKKGLETDQKISLLKECPFRKRNHLTVGLQSLGWGWE